MDSNSILRKTLITVMCVALFQGAAAAAGPGGKTEPGNVDKAAQPGSKYKLTSSQHRLYPALRLQRWGAKLMTWGVQIREHINPDPYGLTIQGVSPGTQITVATQGKHETLPVPKTQRNTWKKLQGKDRKMVRRELSKLTRKRFAEAQRWTEIGRFTFNDADNDGVQTVINEDVLPVHTPMKITAVHPTGRSYPTKVVNAAGLKIKSNISKTFGGRLLPGIELGQMTNPDNIFFAASRVTGPQGESLVRIQGLKAFPAGAKVTVENKTLSEQLGKEVTVQAIADASGSLVPINAPRNTLSIAARRGDVLRFAASFGVRTANDADNPHVKHFVTVLVPQKGSPNPESYQRATFISQFPAASDPSLP